MSNQNGTGRDSARLTQPGSLEAVADGVMPTRRAMSAPWPIAVELSPEVRAAWLALQVGIAEAGIETPCQPDPSAWWYEGGGDAQLRAEAAVRACLSCPALVLCRDYAVKAGRFEAHGIWGGLTAAQRAAMRKAAR